ncbi:MAG: TIGR04282 family arsenosugar biosynthesis glycosyltransferase [Gaiellaceae bacterium]
MSRSVLVVAKAPIPGRAKTRLVPPLTAEQAAALQEALLLDTLETCRAEAPETAILHADRSEAPALARLAGPEVRLVLQEGRGLGDALRLGMARGLAGGPTALVSSDIPGLPPGSLTRAFTLLEERSCDVVLGPALDGGYWLIAMREPSDAPFDAIPWSTPAAFAVTVQQCEEAGLEVATIDPWRDIDTPVDLAFVLRDADQLPAPRTLRVLRALALDGVVPEPPALRLDQSRVVLGSPWRTVIEDRLAGDRDRISSYTYLAVPRAVFVVPVTNTGEVVLVRQYRHPVRDWTLEVPAGSVEDWETPLEAAERELAEEVGGRARDWHHLTTFYSSSAHLSLRSDAFLATGVLLGTPEPGEDEDVVVVPMPVDEALARAHAGEVVEGQSALALLLAAPHLNAARE